MINKKIAMSAVSIITALALAGGATFAFFTDTAVSQNNTFSTGNADLQISTDLSDDPTAYGSEIAAPAVNEPNIFPGFSQGYKFWLKNNSSSAISLDLASLFDDLVILGGNPDLANQLTAQFTCVSDADNNGSLETTIATTGTFTINQWDATLGVGMGTLGLNDGDGDGTGSDETQCTMTVTLPNSVDSTYAGAGLRFDGVFNATQTP